MVPPYRHRIDRLVEGCPPEQTRKLQWSKRWRWWRNSWWMMDGSAVHLKAAVVQNRIMWEVKKQIFYTRRCSKEITFINGALLRHYRTKRMTILKFELYFWMQCVRSPRIDGMRKMTNLQRWHKSIEILGSSTMFFFVTSHQFNYCFVFLIFIKRGFKTRENVCFRSMFLVW